MKLNFNTVIRWTKEDIDFLDKVSESVGMTRSEFIRSSANSSAQVVQKGVIPYFVSEFKNSPQNTRTSSFSSAGNQRIDHGVGNGASTGRGAIDGGASKGRSASRKAKPTGSEKKRSV